MSFSVVDVQTPLLSFALILFASVLASKLSAKLGIPTLIFFLFVGMAVKWLGIMTTTPDIAKFLGIITLILILFLGGLETDLEHVRPIWKSGFVLSTLGAFITTLVVGVFLKWFTAGALEFSFPEGILIGSIVASTDAAAVFSILRARQLRLKDHLGPLLEMESGSNDVMVYFLMTVFLGVVRVGKISFLQVAPIFIQEMVMGTLGGVFLGYAMVWLVNRVNLQPRGLYPTFTLSMVFASYGIVEFFHGSGFLAIYIIGIIMGNHDFTHKRSFIKFSQGFEWLFQITMFVTLGLLIEPAKLAEVMKVGLLLSLVLMLVARPLSVFLGLFFSQFQVRHKTFISWVGLRGAVPIVFATYLYTLENQERADTMFHLIFFVVLISVLLQGTTLYAFAQWLDLEDKRVLAKKDKQILALSDDVKKMLIHLEIPAGSPIHEKRIIDLNLPKEVLIVLIHRDNRYFTPGGNTPILESDKLFIMFDSKKELKQVKEALHIPF